MLEPARRADGVSAPPTVENAVWSLPYPLPEALGAGQHLCFYADKVDIEVDGNAVTS